MTHRSDRTEIYSRVTPDALTRTTLSLIELDNALEYLKERMMFYEDMGVTARRPITGHSALSTLLTTILQEERCRIPSRLFIRSHRIGFSRLRGSSILPTLSKCEQIREYGF